MTFIDGLHRSLHFKKWDQNHRNKKEVRNCYDEPIANIALEDVEDILEDIEDIDDYSD